MASSRFFSLSYALAATGHPVAQQGKQGGPDTVQSVAVVFDRGRSLFQAIFFTDGLDANRLEQDITRAGYHLYTVLPLHVCDPDPGSYPVMRELLRTATPPAAAKPAAAKPAAAKPAAAKPAAAKRSTAAARARAEEAVELLRQLLVL